MSQKYVLISADLIPDGVTFDVPRANQGQAIEVAFGGFGRSERGPGDPYKRVTDRSTAPHSVEYYRRVVDRTTP